MDERAALRTVTSAIKHRRYVLIAIIALVTLAAGVASIVRPPTYQGTALLFVDERFNSSQGFDLALQAGELLSAHFIETATSRPVLERACSGKYFDTPATVGYACSPEGLLASVTASKLIDDYNRLPGLGAVGTMLRGAKYGLFASAGPGRGITPGAAVVVREEVRDAEAIRRVHEDRSISELFV